MLKIKYERISIIHEDNVEKNMTELDKVTALYEELKKTVTIQGRIKKA